MRVFWSLVVLLVIAGGAAAWYQWRQLDADVFDVTDIPLDEPRSVRRETNAEPVRPAPPRPVTHPELSRRRDIPRADHDHAVAETAERTADPMGKEDGATALVEDLVSAANARRDAASEPSPGTSGPGSSADVRSDISTPEGPALDLGLNASINDATVAPGRITQTADGLDADGRFLIKGKGTREDPYLVSWPLLISASETYQPRLGERGIPQRVALLDGKWVRISGFVAFPIVAADPRELLVMLNQWDGCCIGVPPTPFDAIEVRLAAPPGHRLTRIALYGSVTGRLSVEPYLADNWLIGLYLMDDALLEMDL